MASGEIKARLYEHFLTPAVGAGLQAQADRPRRRRQGRGFRPRAAAQGGDGRRADRARTPHPEGRVPAARADWRRRRRPRRSPRDSCWPGSASTSTRPASGSGRRRRNWRSIAHGHDGDARALERAVARGQILGDSSNLARGLRQRAVERADAARLRRSRDRRSRRPPGSGVEILDEKEIARLGMGLLLGVARGSVEPPRVIVMRHEPAGRAEAPVLGLVGKGITFDTGGISIKPAEGMERMKDDMAGGAAVVCAMRAIALLKAPIRVVGIVPTTENMPGGRAMKPGDVLTGAERKDGRGHQHRRRGAAHPRRWSLVRAAAWRDAPGRRRHADGRVRRRAGQGRVGTVRPSRRVARHGAGRRADAPATGAGRCRSTTSTSIRSAARSPT